MKQTLQHNKWWRSLLVVCAFILSGNLFSQTVTWSDTFLLNTPATTTQVNNWNAFRASLQPGNYCGMLIKGTYDQNGIVCNDATITNAFANAVKNNLSYTSVSTNGHVWSVCNRFDQEIWLDPPSQCSGANCPNGYIIRPGIGPGNPNWGGVNTATCGGPNQRMTLIFYGSAAPPTAAGTSVTCGSPATLTATGSTGQYAWYANSTGGTPLGTGATFTTPALTANTTYYVEATANSQFTVTSMATTGVFNIPNHVTYSGDDRGGYCSHAELLLLYR